MQILRRPRLNVERLEARDVPALSVTALASTLILSGTPNGDLSIVGQANGKFEITNGGVTVGQFHLNRALQLNLRNVPGELEIDLNGNKIAGNVIINLGTGNTKVGTSVDIFDSVGTGKISGNLTILGGNGNEEFELGAQRDAGNTRTILPVRVLGNVSIAARAGFGEDKLQVSAGTKIQGSLTTSQVDFVSIGEQNNPDVSFIGGPLSVTTTGANSGTTVNLIGQFNKAVTVNASGTTSGFNSFTLQPVDVGIDTTVGGNLTVTLGRALAGNIFEFLETGTETSVVNGNVTLTSRNTAVAPLTDLYDIQGITNGNMTLNLGTGDNEVFIEDTAFVGGNLRISTTGGGDNVVEIAGSVGSGGALSGNVFITLGNGTNDVLITSETITGKLNYRGGNGTNNLTLDPAAPTLFNVDFLFGTGTNTLDLGSANTSLTGTVRGSGGMNTFLQNDAELLPTLRFISFP
jgi:hypothetical protein